MNYEDEPYFRFYTRDTKTFLSLGLEGQCLLGLIGRKLDRAGVLDDIDDPVEDVAVILHTDQLEFVRRGIERLLAKGVIVHRGRKLIMPNYIKAQTASKSDRQRARDYRDKRRAEALLGVTTSDAIVTERDATVTTSEPKRETDAPTSGVTESDSPVTEREDSSQNVTPPSRPSQPASPKYLYPDLCALPDLQTHVALLDAPVDEAVVERKRVEQAAVLEVFDHWRTVHGHLGSKLDRKRDARIRARMREGFTVERLKTAITNAKNDPHLMGSSGKKYDGIQTLLRDAEQVERLEELTDCPEPRRPAPVPRQANSNYDINAQRPWHDDDFGPFSLEADA